MSAVVTAVVAISPELCAEGRVSSTEHGYHAPPRKYQRRGGGLNNYNIVAARFEHQRPPLPTPQTRSAC